MLSLPYINRNKTFICCLFRTSPHPFLSFPGGLRLLMFHLYSSRVWGIACTEGTVAAQGRRLLQKTASLGAEVTRNPSGPTLLDLTALDVLCFTFYPAGSFVFFFYFYFFYFYFFLIISRNRQLNVAESTGGKTTPSRRVLKVISKD